MGLGKRLLTMALVFGVLMVGLVGCNGDEAATPAPSTTHTKHSA